MLARSDSVPPDAGVAPGLRVTLAGAELVLDPAGALVWPAEGVLVVADLHLEKASAFARRGQLLPPYDTGETLDRLAALVARHGPRALILLGDSFHDRWGAERIDPAARTRIATLGRGRSLVWIAGNHDPDPPAGLPGEGARELRIGPLTFRHEPRGGAAPGEVAGHLHPVARLCVRGRSIRRRCFFTDGTRMVLPALGALAGGLNVRDAAFSSLFGIAGEAHMLGADRTYRIARAACLPD